MTNKAKSSFSADKYRTEAYLLPYFGNIPLSQITRQMVDNYKSKRVKDGASSNAVNRELALNDFDSKGHLRDMITDYFIELNRDPKPVKWTYTKAKFAAKFCPNNSNQLVG